MEELEKKNGNVAEGVKASVSKTEEPSGSGSSNLPISSDEKKRVKKAVEPPVILYKLNFRRPNGDIRSEIPKALVYTLVTNWADLLRIVPANRWSTVEEIVTLVWEWEKRQYRKLYTRTRKQIEDGIRELTEASVIQTKEK